MPLSKRSRLATNQQLQHRCCSDVVGRPPSGDAGLFLRLGLLRFGGLGFDLLGRFLGQKIAVGTANGGGNGVVNGRSESLASNQAAEGAQGQFDLLPGIHHHHPLVQIAVEGQLLHVLVVTHLDEGFSGGVIAIENSLQDVQHRVGGAVLAVPALEVGRLDLLLSGDGGSAIGDFHDCFGTHPAALGSEVDAFA